MDKDDRLINTIKKLEGSHEFPANVKPINSMVVELVENGHHEEDWNVRMRMQLWRVARSGGYWRKRGARALIIAQQIFRPRIDS